MDFRKKLFQGALICVLLFQAAGVAWGARVAVSGTGTQDAIDTLAFSGGAAANGATAPVVVEMIIFNTFDGDSPDTVRNRIVALGADLNDFTVTPVPGQPNQFEVDNIPPGGALLIELNGQEVTSDPESSPVSHAGQRFRLVAGQIPTLSEWGLIIFATLLLAGLTWFIRRRHRLAKV